MKRYVPLERITANYLLESIGRATIQYLHYFKLSGIPLDRMQPTILSVTDAIALGRASIAYWQEKTSSLSDAASSQVIMALGLDVSAISREKCRAIWDEIDKQCMQALENELFNVETSKGIFLSGDNIGLLYC